MANLLIIDVLSNDVAANYNEMRKLTQINRIIFSEPYFKLVNMANLLIVDVLTNRVAAN